MTLYRAHQSYDGMAWLLPFFPLHTHCYFINFSNMIMWCMYLGHGFMKDFGCPLFTLTSFFLEREKNSSTSKDWRERNIIAVWKDSCLSIRPYSKASTACLCQQVTKVFFISVGFGRFPWKVKRQFWNTCFFSRNVTLSKEWGLEENGWHPWEKSAQYPPDTTAEKIDVSKIVKYSDWMYFW